MSYAPSPSQWALVSFSLLYPIVFYYSTPPNASPARFAKGREAISIFHCTLMTTLSLICLRQSSAIWSSAADKRAGRSPVVRDVDLPIITTRSEFANCLTAIETAYLVQDSMILFWADRVHRRARAAGFQHLKGLNIKHLACHHAGFVGAFGTLQWYIARGEEKGILIIVLMLLMNASSPIGALRWYLVNFHPNSRRAIRAFTAAYLAVFGMCRIYLIYYILQIFGAQQGQSAFEAYLRLRVPCKLGIGSIATVNITWFTMGLARFLTRDLRLGHGTRKRE